MEKEEKVTVPAEETAKTEEKDKTIVDNTTKSENYTQKDLSNLIAKETKKAQEKILKDLGVEDFKSAKEGLVKLKEIQDAQKTETQRIQDENERLTKENNSLKEEKKEREIIDSIGDILSDMEIDKKYSNTIKKLMDLTDVEDYSAETLKPLVEKVINEELPMLFNNNDEIKIGTEKNNEPTYKSNNPSTMDYETYKKWRKTI